jgi:hypothetical protein
MQALMSAPLLYRVKTWQFIGLGLTGWVTLYSIALINWSSCSAIIGNAQGGCFATTLALAGLEARRLNKRKMRREHDALHWADDVSTFELVQALDQIQQRKGFTTEALHCQETQMGFGLRAVKDGRTIVFETSRWKESTINLLHVQTANENRRQAMADRAVIVGIGVPDEDTKRFVKSAPIQLLVGEDLQNLIESEIYEPADKAQNQPAPV